MSKLTPGKEYERKFLGRAGLFTEAVRRAARQLRIRQGWLALAPAQVRVRHTHGEGYVLEIKGKDGQIATWSVEGAGPGALSRRGFNKSDVKIGDTLTVDGYLARSGKRVIDGQRVTLPDGRVFDSGSTGTGGPGSGAAPLPASAGAKPAAKPAGSGN